MKEAIFLSVTLASKEKPARREVLQREVDAVTPWARHIMLIVPCCPKARNSGTAAAPEIMLHVHPREQQIKLLSSVAEDSLHDIESMRCFAGVELAEDLVHDETTIRNFDKFTGWRQLAIVIFKAVNVLLSEMRLLSKTVSLVDAANVGTSFWTRKEARAGELKIRLAENGNWGQFTMRAYFGADRGGVAHLVTTTTVKGVGITQLARLLRSAESEVHGDRGCYSKANVRLRKPGIRSRLQKRLSRNRPPR